MLPESEIELLNSLTSSITLKDRLYRLAKAGWSYDVLGKSLNPQRPKSTIHHWVTTHLTTTSDQVMWPNNPIPKVPAKPLPIRSITPKVPKQANEELKRLAPLARQFRAKTPSDSIFRTSNDRLTQLATELYTKGVPIHEIAKSTGVSDRAIYKRIEKGLRKDDI